MLLKHSEQNTAVLGVTIHKWVQDNDYYELAVAYVSIKTSVEPLWKRNILIIHFYFNCQTHNSQEVFVAIQPATTHSLDNHCSKDLCRAAFK